MYIKPHVFPYFLQPWWVSKCKVERVSSPFCWHFSPTTRCFNQKNPTNKNPLKVLKAVKRVSLRKNILGEFFQATPETTIFLKDWPVADKSLKQSQGGLGPVNQGQQGGLVGGVFWKCHGYIFQGPSFLVSMLLFLEGLVH